MLPWSWVVALVVGGLLVSMLLSTWRFHCSRPLARTSLRWMDASRTPQLVSGIVHKAGTEDRSTACLLGSSTIARLGDDIVSEEEDGNRVINLGIEGLQTKHMLTDEFRHAWQTRVSLLPVALVYIGINDAMFDPDPDDLADRIVQVLRLVQTRARRVLYLPILESNFQRWGGTRRVEYVRRINRLVRERCARTEDDRLVIVTPPALEACDFVWDGIHLNEHGNAKLQERVREWCARRSM